LQEKAIFAVTKRQIEGDSGMENPTQPKFKWPLFDKIEQNMAEGNYYAAQQLYKTLYFRLSKKKDIKGSTELFIHGACSMLKHGQFNNGVELALLLFDHFKNNQISANQETIDSILEIYSLFPLSLTDPVYRRFVKTAMNWSSSASNNQQGDPRLHNAFALVYAQAKDNEKAEQHYLRGDNPKAFAEFLFSRSEPNVELDIIVARAIFQYLCLSNLKDANILYSTIMELGPEKLSTSNLITFLKYLLQTLERDAYPLSKLLQERYALSIKRDPNFEKYMDMINKIYFNVDNSQKGFGALFGNLLSSFMNS